MAAIIRQICDNESFFMGIPCSDSVLAHCTPMFERCRNISGDFYYHPETVKMICGWKR